MAQPDCCIRYLNAVCPVNFEHNVIFANLNPAFHTRKITELDGTRDCYWSIAAFPPEAKTNLGDNALHTMALVIDDVGTKGPSAEMVERALGRPTAIVETSPGNFQWAYRLSKPVKAWDGFFAGVELRIGHTEPLEARSAQTLMRLPMGLNTFSPPSKKALKEKYGTYPVTLVELNPEIELDPDTIPHVLRPGPSPQSSGGGANEKYTENELWELVSLFPNTKKVSYDPWFTVSTGIKALCRTWEEGFRIFDAWSSLNLKYDPEETQERWNNLPLNKLKSKGQEFKAMIQKHDPEGYAAWAAKAARERFDDKPEAPSASVDVYAALHADMAADIVRKQRAVLGWLSNSQGRRWGGFDGVLGRWVIEDHDALMRAAVREEVRAARIAPTTEEKTARKMAEAKWQSAVQGLLTRHTELMIPFERFDADLDTFGVPGGVVKLAAAGAIEAAGAAAQMVSRAMSVRPAPCGAKGVVWEKFLNDFTMGDRELRAWWQAFCGYCLTGRTHEHMVVFLYGPGGNGKSVFLDTLGEVMGPYHERAASAVFMAGQGHKHMAMVADLAGARLVTSPDVPLGAEWDLGMLKPLTGGGTFKAQFMKENWFAFVPQFKLILAGNEKPILGAVDAAVRRRFWLVPAMHVPKTVNKQLIDVLRQEHAAILRWMIDGWNSYNALGGLPPCRLIEQATEEYISEQDTFSKWLGDTLTKTPGDMTRHRMIDLWSSWDTFRAMNGLWKVSPVSVQKLSSKLKELGFSVDRDEHGGYVDQISVVKSTIF